jgi:hypothetical protein
VPQVLSPFTWLATVALSLPAVLLAGVPALAQAGSAPAVPVDPVAAIVEAFKAHPIVAIGDNHGNLQLHEFRLALLRDPRLLGVVDDIVVEFGTATHQALIDRYVTGEAVSREQLRHVWEDTTQIEETWDLPIYEAFFEAVRAVNLGRPAQQRLRVLLGDPPVDWSAIKTTQDLKSLPDRDGHAADVIMRDVLAKKRRALVIYGDQHLVRRTTLADAPDPWAHGLIARLERGGQRVAFTVHAESRADLAAVQPDVATWPRPSLARLAGTSFGAQIADTAPGRRAVRQDEQFDAVLYLGPPATMRSAALADARCEDEAYLRMRTTRLALLGPPATAPFDPSDRITVDCAFRGLPARVVEDALPAFTASVRGAIDDVMVPRVEPARFAVERRARLVAFFQMYAPRVIAPLGAVRSIDLTGDATVIGTRYRRYRVTHERGVTVWIVGVAADGTIASMQPRRE